MHNVSPKWVHCIKTIIKRHKTNKILNCEYLANYTLNCCWKQYFLIETMICFCIYPSFLNLIFYWSFTFFQWRLYHSHHLFKLKICPYAWTLGITSPHPQFYVHVKNPPASIMRWHPTHHTTENVISMFYSLKV